MKNILVLVLIIFLQLNGNTQDFIYKKDNIVQEGKILEITTDKIKYKKAEIPKGPTYEILLSDVIKIRYNNGYTDIINPLLNDSLIKKNNNIGFDTLSFSLIYILFNHGQDLSQNFPIYLNGEYLLTIRNHTRVCYKRFTTGDQIFERRGVNTYKNGPRTTIFIEAGKSYGIRIKEPYPQGLDPNRRFSIEVIKDSIEFNTFLKDEFYGFNPFKEDDIKIEEPKVKK